ncbi:hypothetical protein GCM10027347_59540 [Larkinella harenae]
MKFILIILAFSTRGVAVESAEFDDRAACVEAQKAVERERSFASPGIEAHCIAKGIN